MVKRRIGMVWKGGRCKVGRNMEEGGKIGKGKEGADGVGEE